MKILERHESYNDRSNRIVYSVICLVCGAFIEIAPNLIPEILKKSDFCKS